MEIHDVSPVSDPELDRLVESWQQTLRVPARATYASRDQLTSRDLDALNLVGDPIAEDFVAAKNAAGLKDVDDLVALETLRDRGCAAAIALWAAVNHVPSFIDFDEMRPAASYAYRNVLAFTVLQFAAFPFTYTGANVAHVLDFSGRLGRDGDQVRRFWETIRATLSAFDIDAMRPGGESWARWIRVRLMHTRVRLGIARSGTWDYGDGAPISALNIAGGVYTFGTFLLLAGTSLGARPSQPEYTATLRLWQWVTHLQGGPGELILENLDDQNASDRDLIRYLYRPTEAGRRLTADWIDCVAAGLDGNPLPKWLVQAAVRHALTGSLTGMPELASKAADDMHIPRNRGAGHIVRGIAALNALIGWAGHLGLLRTRIERYGHNAAAKSVAQGLGGDDANHYTPLG
ncbi:DUF2236 domain-containing protein [Mycolicibacterium sp. CH28]|uniref:oxygenase MpaB family protein n=1 Tax=Mycolicibacterium sp. CH28 TaxID=2512237 RepID=UPI0010808BDB|nr:oxygenase MpaB family protein [Mycolicibacterium sp. CH28]TGD86306.1 DUF2236 domain-containing protein [Mycolicibacterium sp. CH28]